MTTLAFRRRAERGLAVLWVSPTFLLSKLFRKLRLRWQRLWWARVHTLRMRNY